MARTPRATPTFYVRFDTYWQHSPDRFVGPFITRAAAQAIIDGIETGENVWRADSMCGGDIRTAIRVYPEVLTASQARRMGMRDAYSELPKDTDELFDLESNFARY